MIATVSPVSRQVAWKTTPKEPLPTTRVVEKEKVGPAGGEGGAAEAEAGAAAPEEEAVVAVAAAPLLAAAAPPPPPPPLPPRPPREATGAVRMTWEPEAGSPSTTRPS